MKTIYHKADSRGHANHGWLDTYHTFSFGNYYDPERMHFGMLRVLNDDTVAPGMGFSKHPHDNMEIISIPISGDLEHEDSMGNKGIIREGDIQVMSAGKGIFHSEKNKNRDREVKFLQIWIFPDKHNVEPRYDQISMKDHVNINEFSLVLSPNPDDQGVWIHQKAYFSMGSFDRSSEDEYNLYEPRNGVYLFVIEGKIKAGDIELNRRDGLGITEANSIRYTAATGSKVLLMEIPMG
ncbi:MAG: pirin family protein [Bacteroidales bacterium]|nr:pirin family protein [Bacteroidales bacterium]